MSVSFPTFPTGNIARGVNIDQKATKFSTSLSSIPRKLLILGSPTTNIEVESYPKNIIDISQASIYGEGSQLYNMIDTALSYSSRLDIYAMPIICQSGSQAQAEITFSDTATSTGSLYFYIDGTQVVVPVSSGDTGVEIALSMLDVVASNIYLPCTAAIKDDDDTTIVLTAKWKGITGNDIKIIQNYYNSDSDNTSSGVIVSSTGFQNGAGVVDVSSTLENWGDTWFTMVASAFKDEVTLKALGELADSYIGALEMRPFQVVVGSNSSRDDYISFVSPLNYSHLIVMQVEESPTPNYLIAASAATFIEDLHAESPSASYYGTFKTILAGQNLKSSNQTIKDTIMKNGGCTTIANADNSVNIENTVTTYKKNEAGVASNDWRYPQVMACYQYYLYNMKTIFNTSPFTRAILVDESQSTTNPLAVTPSRVKAAVMEVVRLLGDKAVIKKTDHTLANMTSYIDEENPTRVVTSLEIYWALPLEQKVFMTEWTVAA